MTGRGQTARSWRPRRTVAALAALALLVLGGIFLRLLVANWSDNAYLGLALIGVALLLTSSPFLLAAILPDSWARRLVLALGLALLCLVGLLGSGILIWSLVVIPSQNYRSDTRVFGRHLVGLVILVPTILGTVLCLLRRRRS